MHTRSAAGDRDIDPIVDEDSRRRAAGSRRVANQAGKLAALQIRFADLHDVDAGVDVVDLLKETWPGVHGGHLAPTEPSAVGDGWDPQHDVVPIPRRGHGGEFREAGRRG